MYHAFEQNFGRRRTIIATGETFEEVKAKVEAMGVAFMEDDDMFHGCADAYLNDSRIIAIQPEDFTFDKYARED